MLALAQESLDFSIDEYLLLHTNTNASSTISSHCCLLVATVNSPTHPSQNRISVAIGKIK